jgi:hypothetical protein
VARCFLFSAKIADGKYEMGVLDLSDYDFYPGYSDPLPERITTFPNPQGTPPTRLNKATTSETPFTIGDPDQSVSWHDFIIDSLTSAARLFWTESTVFLVTVMCAIAFGKIYLLTEALPAIHTQSPFSFTTKQTSFSFIPITIGLGLDIFPRFYDHNLLKRMMPCQKS